MGPTNPQALNRYSYMQNNPVRYVDPSGHSVYMSKDEAQAYVTQLKETVAILQKAIEMLNYGASGVAILATLAALSPDPTVSKMVAAALGLVAGTGFAAALALGYIANQIDTYANTINTIISDKDNKSGVIISVCADVALTCKVTVVSRDTGNGVVIDMAHGPSAILFGITSRLTVHQ
jgi:hypothetical protein